jgi:hypothetical protein
MDASPNRHIRAVTFTTNSCSHALTSKFDVTKEKKRAAYKITPNNRIFHPWKLKIKLHNEKGDQVKEDEMGEVCCT